MGLSWVEYVSWLVTLPLTGIGVAPVGADLRLFARAEWRARWRSQLLSALIVAATVATVVAAFVATAFLITPLAVNAKRTRPARSLRME
jgi:hypothetical protein